MAILLCSCMNTFLGCFFVVVSVWFGERLFYGSYAGRIHPDPVIQGFYSYLLATGAPFAQFYNRPDENEDDDTKPKILYYCRIQRTRPFHTCASFASLF